MGLFFLGHLTFIRDKEGVRERNIENLKDISQSQEILRGKTAKEFFSYSEISTIYW